MNHSDNALPFRSVTEDILRRIIIVASMSVVLIGAVQSWLQYRSEVERVNHLVETLSQAHVPLLTVALWDIEPSVAERQISMIAAHQEIRSVSLSTATGVLFQSGDIERDAEPDFLVSVPHPKGEGEPLGKLGVFYNRQEIQRGILVGVATSTLKLSLFILLVCLVVYRVIFYRLKKPLRQIAAYSQKLTPDRAIQPLMIARPHRPWRDEIDLVSEGFDTLREAITRYGRERDSAMADLAKERDLLEHRVDERTREVEESRRELFRLSRTDPLTGLANRRSFDEASGIEERRARRNHTPLSLVMIDIDYFKAYNDFYGHSRGDECLAKVAGIMMEHCRRAGELAVRMGGEEFALLLPGQDQQGTAELVEMLREAIFDRNIPHRNSPLGRVSVCLGSATWEPDGRISPNDRMVDRLLSIADKRLYRAKKAGRNRACATDAPDPNT